MLVRAYDIIEDLRWVERLGRELEEADRDLSPLIRLAYSNPRASALRWDKFVAGRVEPHDAVLKWIARGEHDLQVIRKSDPSRLVVLLLTHDFPVRHWHGLEEAMRTYKSNAAAFRTLADGPA